MPLHIESVSADVTMYDGELPLSERQLCQIADHVVGLLAKRDREAAHQREATQVKRSAQAPSAVGG